jgi:hypothetical protein
MGFARVAGLGKMRLVADPGDVGVRGASDTVGESFELNIAAALETETLTGTAKPIILTQGSMRGKWNLGYSNTA